MKEVVDQQCMIETHLLEGNSQTLMWAMALERETLLLEVDSHHQLEVPQSENLMLRELHLEKSMLKLQE